MWQKRDGIPLFQAFQDSGLGFLLQIAYIYDQKDQTKKSMYISQILTPCMVFLPIHLGSLAGKCWYTIHGS